MHIAPVSEDSAYALGIPDNSGEFIQAVLPGGPAAEAGLQAGDVVIKVGRYNVSGLQSLSYLFANIAPGTVVPIQFIRNGERRTVNVTVGRRPTEAELQAQLRTPGIKGATDRPVAPD